METQSVKRTADFFAEPFRIFAMVRLSHSPIVNVTSGGGETGFFVIEEHMARRKKEPLNRNCRRAC